MMDELRECLMRRLEGASPLFCALSGAHLYGFASPDSDFDVRGAHLLPLAEVLSLFPKRETIEYSATENGRDIDLVSHDAGKFFGLMLKKNGYVMEQIFSPHVVVGGPDLEELRALAGGCISRHIYHPYRGFAENHLRMLEREQPKRAKTLLYLSRVLLTGIHVLQTGEIESNLGKLVERYPQGSGPKDLMAAKVREKAEVSDASAHEKKIHELRGALDEAFAKSTLPEEPRRARNLDAFLVRLRLKSGPRP